MGLTADVLSAHGRAYRQLGKSREKRLPLFSMGAELSNAKPAGGHQMDRHDDADT